jgi:hypothetical protein
MPKLAVGGKYVYGWAVISSGGELPIPDEARAEYGVEGEQDLVLVQGSETSGGFGASRRETLESSAMGVILERYTELTETPPGRPVVVEGRSKMYARAHLGADHRLRLAPEIMKAFRVKPGDKLLAVRGSGIAVGFVAHGPIVNEAEKHGDLPVSE